MRHNLPGFYTFGRTLVGGTSCGVRVSVWRTRSTQAGSKRQPAPIIHCSLGTNYIGSQIWCLPWSFSPESQWCEELEASLGGIHSRLVDHSSFIGSRHNLLPHDFYHDLDAYMQSLFAAVCVHEVCFRYETSSVAIAHRVTLLHDDFLSVFTPIISKHPWPRRVLIRYPPIPKP